MSISVRGLSLAEAFVNSDAIVIGAMALLAVVIGGIAGVIPPRRAAGPLRIPDESPALPLAIVLFFGFGLYLFASSVIIASWKKIAVQYGLGDSDIMQSELGLAIVSSVPPIVAAVAMLVGDAAIFPVVHQRLGLALKHLPLGILRGFAAAIIVIPLMFLAEQLLEVIYVRLHYEHPLQHQLLKAMGESPKVFVRFALIASACVVAPFWEELLFRAHIQTLLRRGFGSFFRQDNRQYRTVAAWMAIFVTSFVFAALHERWEAPIIFLLAICMGYAYERTGNLWIPITVHAIFNTISTAIFLHVGA